MNRTIGFKAIAGLLLFLPAALYGGTYEIDTAHSSIGFSIRHLGISKVKGHFGDFSGTIEFDEGDVESGSAVVNIKAASVNTGNDGRDEHLRGPDFFDVEKFPTIQFKSTGVGKTEDGYVLLGHLFIHGVEKKVRIPFEILGVAKDPWGGTRAGFEGKIQIRREDYKVGWEDAKFRPPLIGNEVDITLNLEAILKE